MQESTLAARSAVQHDFHFADRKKQSGITFLNQIVDDAGKAYKKVHYDHGTGLCATDDYLYFVTQRGSNELWESVYYKQNAATPGFALFPREGRHKGAYCVWELGPVWHEQQAWVRFLTSPRDVAAQQTYLDDRFSGSVG